MSRREQDRREKGAIKSCFTMGPKKWGRGKGVKLRGRKYASPKASKEGPSHR